MKKRALISVYDKTGIVDFSKELVNLGYEIISTSGTAKLLQDNGIQIKTVEEITKSPEVLGGRVKTLHPFVFAGLLADKENPEHIKQVEQYGFEMIDLCVVSLYPFAETIAKPDCPVTEAIEQIDIGGVSLIRAAAKNYNSVSVIVSQSQYKEFLSAAKNNSLNKDFNLRFASEAFEYVSEYDKAIADYYRKISGSSANDELVVRYKSSRTLRYGENPHQKANLLSYSTNGFDDIFSQHHGKELSYINILDIDAAYNLISEFNEPTCAIIKHANPSGVASGKNIFEAYKKAFACDTVSPFGGIVIVNEPLDLKISGEIDKIFTEIIIAPEFNPDALEFLAKKKNRRLISYKKDFVKQSDIRLIKSVEGGLLIQDNDSDVVNENQMRIVTKRHPSINEMSDLLFAMKVAKHVKSNAVVYAINMQTLGIGGGQPSRVDSSMLAVSRANRFGLSLNGCAVASDAFFPFPDGIIEAAKSGAKSVIQPGGSVRDDEVIKAADEFGLAMVFTGIRHFRH